MRCESQTYNDGYDCHSFSGGGGARLRTLSSLQSGESTESLRPGNYLLLTWDCETLGGSLYQVGCQSYHGDCLLLCLLPDTEAGLTLARQHYHCPLVVMSGQSYLRHTNNGQFKPCIQQREALTRLISFLETCRNRTRPSYDGVVLVSHTLDTVTDLIKTFRKHELYDKLRQQVSAVGDLTKLLQNKKVHGVTDSSSLEACYNAVLHRKMYPIHPMSDDTARICFDIIGKVLDSPPTFRNLFSVCSQPLSSSSVQTKINFRTSEEKAEMFQSLQEDMEAELERGRRESRQTFYPGESEREESPASTARAIVQQLLNAGFQFDQLLEMSKVRGVGQLELQVRTAFLGQMAGR